MKQRQPCVLLKYHFKGLNFPHVYDPFYYSSITEKEYIDKNMSIVFSDNTIREESLKRWRVSSSNLLS